MPAKPTYEELKKRVRQLEEEIQTELKIANEKLELEIQERNRIEAELRQANRYLENVLNSSADGIGIVDQHGKFIKWNKAAMELYGYTQDEIRGKSTFDLYPDGEELDKMLNRLRSKGFVKGYEMDMITKNGSVIPFEISIAMLKDELQTDIGSVCVARDLSDLKKALVQAEAANQAKSEFLANMSHEIRTPMNAVIGFTELLESVITDKRQKNYLEAIKSGGKGLLTIINDILDLSKIEAGKLKIQYEPVNPRMIFNEIKNIFSLKLSRKGIELITEIDPELPLSLIMDEVRLRQILLNLVGNAIKFTDKGSVKLSIHQDHAVHADSLINIQIVVEDTGIGIPETEYENIFEPFKQQNGQDMKTFGGTGLGLAICKRLVEMLEGEISVTSEKGKGSRFKIRLRDIAIADTSAVKPREVSDLVDIMFEKATILAVDDVTSNLTLIKEHFRDTNVTVIVAEDGEQALLFAREYLPDLILMDIRMPVMDGYEATQLVKSDDKLKHIPVIALTASFIGKKKNDLEKYGFEDYLRKPVTRVSLFQKLCCFLKHSVPDKPAEKQPEDFGPEDLPRLPDLIERLDKELMPLWTDLRKRQPVRAVKEFGKHMKTLGDVFNLEIVKEFGNDLLLCLDDFDIENMRNKLAGFPELIEKLKSAGNYRPLTANTSIGRHKALSFSSLLKVCDRHEDVSVIRDMKASSILIVDDDPKAIQLIGYILRKKGYKVEFATSGKEALEWVDSGRFDLIFLDVVMPGMNGFDVCKKLKALPGTKDVPIIFLTVKTETCDIVKGFQIGGVDYVTKPFNPIELIARVDTHLELKFSRDILRKRALMDGLTKLYNHSHIHERLSQEISRARRYDQPLSIIMLDMDYFKKINDTHGHKTGDEILVRAASSIRISLRKEDIAGRYGGEEFLIILPNTNQQAASLVAEKVKTNIQSNNSGTKGLTVTISGGVCSFENEDANELIVKADRLLYKAKNNGRNRIELA